MHTHMNSTRWESLTNFVLYLGRTGKAIVEETEKGLFIKYVHKDPEAEARRAAVDAQQKAEVEEQERQLRIIQRQAALAREFESQAENGLNFDADALEGASDIEWSDMDDDDDDDAEAIEAAPASEDQVQPPAAKRRRGFLVKSGEPLSISLSGSFAVALQSATPAATTSLTIPQSDRKRKLEESSNLESQNALSSAATESLPSNFQAERWLFRGLVVKILSKVGDSRFYKKKAEVIDVIDNYTAKLRCDDGAQLLIDERDLETVCPALGKPVLVVGGVHRGESAVLDSLDDKTLIASVSLQNGKQLLLPLSCFCKYVL